MKLKRIPLESIETLNVYTQEEIVANKFRPLCEITTSKDTKTSITINSDNMNKINKILDKYTKEYSVKEINLKLKNKTYEQLKTLAPYTKDSKIIINYGDTIPTDYDNFISMRATIDWYKDLISQNNLSPIEKTMFAYDIIKSFQYNENQEDKSKSRYIPNIIESGNIVCVGYAAFLAELLTELDVPTIPVSVTCKDVNNNDVGHQRNLVRIEDDKYNIHGVFSLDATWDSKKKELSLVTDEEGKKQVRYIRKATDSIMETYDGLSLYQNFLVPYQDYHKVYQTDSLPNLYKAAEALEIKEMETINPITGSKNNTKTLNILAEEQLESLFTQEESADFINKSIVTATKPSLETFKEIISTVRQAEGYSNEYLTESVTSTIELNQMIEELSRPENKTFFSSSSKERTGQK